FTARQQPAASRMTVSAGCWYVIPDLPCDRLPRAYAGILGRVIMACQSPALVRLQPSLMRVVVLDQNRSLPGRLSNCPEPTMRKLVSMRSGRNLTPVWVLPLK